MTEELVSIVCGDFPVMNLTTATEMDRALRSAMNVNRVDLYLMWKREGWAHVMPRGATFADYCDTCEIPRATAYDWIRQVEVSLCAQGVTDLLTATSDLRNRELKMLPATMARELAKLKDPHAIKSAWEKINALSSDHSLPNHVARTAKMIVEQETKRALPKPAVIETAFEKAAQEHIPAPPRSMPDPMKPAQPAETRAQGNVASFMPVLEMGEPEPHVDEAPDFAGFEEAILTLLTWVQNEDATGDTRERLLICADVRDACTWAEGGC